MKKQQQTVRFINISFYYYSEIKANDFFHSSNTRIVYNMLLRHFFTCAGTLATKRLGYDLSEKLALPCHFFL